MAIADGFHVDSVGNHWIGSNRETFDATTRSEAPFYVSADGNLVAKSGTFSGNLSAAGGTFSGDISGASGTFTGSLSGASISGGSININNNFIVDSSGNLTANNATLNGYLTTTSTINADNITTGTLNVGNINVSGKISFVDNTDVDSSAIVNKLDNGAIPDTKLGNVSASKISAGTLSGMFISGGSVNFGGTFVADTSGMTAVAAVNISPTSGTIGNANNSLAGNSLTVYGGGTIQGTIQADNFKDRTTSTNIDMGSTSVDMKPNNSLKARFTTVQMTSYDDIRPSPDNTYDLGSSSARWDDVFASNGTIQTSDVTLKSNISTTDLGLDFVNDLNPIEFTWTDGGVRTHLGFSAQDIKEKLITHKGADQNMAVYTQASYETQYEENDDGELVELETPVERYGLRVNELIPVLTKAIQELSAKNDELESRIAALEA